MGIKDFLRRLTARREREDYPEIKKALPEEVELRGYYEQERRDKLRALLHQKRKQHNQFLNYKSSYNYNKDVADPFTKSRPSHRFYGKKQKKEDLFFRF